MNTTEVGEDIYGRFADVYGGWSECFWDSETSKVNK